MVRLWKNMKSLGKMGMTETLANRYRALLNHIVTTSHLNLWGSEIVAQDNLAGKR